MSRGRSRRSTSDFEDNIRRLSGIVPGYDQLRRELTGEVAITRIDFPENGPGRSWNPVIWGRPVAALNLEGWLTDGVGNGWTRYLLVEDITSAVCVALGSTFDLDPQFFLDHMNNQVSGYSPGEGDEKIQWNTWNLQKSYMSFHWYRPVSRSKDHNGARKRKQMEELYTRVVRDSVTTSRGKTQYSYTIDVVRPVSNILRSEWDLSAVASSSVATEGLVAIEERVSIYQTRLGGCQYVIMLLDAVPKVSQAIWTESTLPPKPFIPPRTARFAQWDLYDSLVPRFTPDMSTSKISHLDEDTLKNIYSTIFSTMTCLKNNSDSANQANNQVPRPCGRLPFLLLFQIVISDTLGLLSLLDTVQSDIVQSTASESAELDDILSRRTFIAKLQSQLPPLNRELKQVLKGLLERGNGEKSHYDAIEQLGSYFEKTIQELKDGSNAITGTLQFMESHRAIMEAESVTRLTELAFLFIPLSFAASLFSMQIQELANPVPVRNFVAFAIPLSASTYLLRLVARSVWVHRQKQSLLASIRERSAVPPGAPIPNMAFFAWVYARLGPAIGLVLFATCCLVPPLVAIWVRELDTGLKIGLTFMFFLFVVVTVSVAVLLVPNLRRQLRDGMRISWYNAAEEDGEPNDREPFQKRFVKWVGMS